MFQPCFLAVEMKPRMVAKSFAEEMLGSEAAGKIFCLSFSSCARPAIGLIVGEAASATGMARKRSASSLRVLKT